MLWIINIALGVCSWTVIKILTLWLVAIMEWKLCWRLIEFKIDFIENLSDLKLIELKSYWTENWLYLDMIDMRIHRFESEFN